MPSLAAVAGLVQANARSFEEAVPGLVAALDEALPGSVQVEREGGLLRRGDRIRSVSVLVGEYRFVLARRANRLEPTIHHEVRGVALKHDAVSPAEWLQRLGVQLRELAASTGPVNPAIGHLLRMP
jgi:hypothetical protein